MIKKILPEAFMQIIGTHPILDVRSPKEYAEGHVPGSINIPILDDDQREQVGITYKEKGRDAAVELGLELVGPMIANMVRDCKRKFQDKTLCLYCWRGGLRSATMAWLLDLSGWDCILVDGGYKAFRNYAKSKLEEASKVYIIGGFTGSGKTRVLDELSLLGEQILDIEKEANHRGSSFGAIGQKAQKTNEQFENELILKWNAFDLSKRIWIEDESRILGSNHIPDQLYHKMRNAIVFKMNVSKGIRAQNLVEDYAHLEEDQLSKAIKRIERKLGGNEMKKALQALKEKDFKCVAEIGLQYYDKTYTFGFSKRDKNSIIELSPNLCDPVLVAKEVISLLENKNKKA